MEETSRVYQYGAFRSDPFPKKASRTRLSEGGEKTTIFGMRSSRRRFSHLRLSLGALALGTLVFASSASAWTGDVAPAVDEDGDPGNGIFEITLTADEALHDITGGGVMAEMFAFNGQVPGPAIEVPVGTRLIIHVHNLLDDPPPAGEHDRSITVHWHGIELNNFSDGTPVTQNPIPAGGGSYDYDFIVTRPGVFWYHPHVAPTDQVFRGLYGSIVVTDPAEEILTNAGVLPETVKTLILADTTLCTDVDSSDPPRIQAQCSGKPANHIPPVQPEWDCRSTSTCQVREGKRIQSNGRSLLSTDVLEVPEGTGVRFRVMNGAIMRYFRLYGLDANGDPLPLYRVGGQGGLLDTVRLEGGTLGTVDMGYNSGELLLTPGDRTDFVIVPVGDVGDEITIESDYSPGDNYNRGAGTWGSLPVGPVARLRIVEHPDDPDPPPYTIADGDPLMTHTLVNEPQEDLGTILAEDLDALLDPNLIPNPVADTSGDTITPTPGSSNSLITLQKAVEYPAGVGYSGPAIDGVRAMFDELHPGDFSTIPYVESTRFAFSDSVLELAIFNDTFSDHPFHLHGFSIQPMHLDDGDGGSWSFPYNEYLDNINIKAGHTLTFRVRLEARPMAGATPGEGGGENGRWVFHCHIFHHAGLGMISELVVLPVSPLDVFMVVDQSGSFADDLVAFQLEAGSIVDTLLNVSPDVRVGLAEFVDYPISPYGSTGDVPYDRVSDLVDLHANEVAFQGFISGMGPASGGADLPESQLTALYQAATGVGQGNPGDPAYIAPNLQANFANDTSKFFLLWTDADYHDSGSDPMYPGPDFTTTVAAIQALDPPMVLGLSSGGGGVAGLNALATATGAVATSPVDCDGDDRVDINPGEPLVCTIGGDGTGLRVAIDKLLRGALLASTPKARCQDIRLEQACGANVSINNNSSDPQGDPLTFLQTPRAPYSVGVTPVSLQVTDSTGLSDSCVATVTVVENVPPNVSCNAPLQFASLDLPLDIRATASDNCAVELIPRVDGLDCLGNCSVSINGPTVTVNHAPVGTAFTWRARVTDHGGNTTSTQCYTAVPEPRLGLMLGAGVGVLLALGRRRAALCMPAQ